MTNRTDRPFVVFLRRWGTAILLALGLALLYYTVIQRFTTSPENDDYHYHILWALYLQPADLLGSFTDGSEHLWHICVKLLYMAGIYDPWYAAGIVTATAEGISCLLLFKAADETVDSTFPRWLLALFTVSLFLVGALTLPGGKLYVDTGALNSWHNPTAIMVRPFAAAVFYMTVRIYNRARFGVHAVDAPAKTADFSFPGGLWRGLRAPVYTGAECVLYPLCLLLSAYAKPSFLQMFAPAVFLFLLIDLIRTKGRLLPFCLKLAVSYLPAALVLFSQLSAYFGSLFSVAAAAAESVASDAAEADGVAIYFLAEEFSGFGDFLSKLGCGFGLLLRPTAFPLFVLALTAWEKGPSATASRLGGIGLGCAWLEALFLHETGSRATHANFLWALRLASWLLWSVAIPRYIALIRKKDTAGQLARWIGTPLFLWHLSCGILYLVRIFQTGIYLI